MVNYTLWSNLRALSQTKKKGQKIGKLRFKSATRYRTLNYNQSGFKIDREQSRITFSKIGTIPPSKQKTSKQDPQCLIASH